MCLICLALQKNKITFDEARRAVREQYNELTLPHAVKVLEDIDRLERLIADMQEKY